MICHWFFVWGNRCLLTAPQESFHTTQEQKVWFIFCRGHGWHNSHSQGHLHSYVLHSNPVQATLLEAMKFLVSLDRVSGLLGPKQSLEAICAFIFLDWVYNFSSKVGSIWKEGDADNDYSWATDMSFNIYCTCIPGLNLWVSFRFNVGKGSGLVLI